MSTDWSSCPGTSCPRPRRWWWLSPIANSGTWAWRNSRARSRRAAASSMSSRSSIARRSQRPGSVCGACERAAESLTGKPAMNVPNALTVDVEDYFHVAALAPNIHRDSWTSRESRVVANTQRLLAIFEQFDVRGTFFVLGWVAEHHPQLIRDIAARGHEIACHGFSHRLVYEQSPEEFYQETLRAKKLLQDITGSAVLGYRAAFYSIVRDSLWALDLLPELGFLYDSSIFPVRHDRYGIPDAERAPHRLSTPTGKFIVEWPLATARILGFRLPVAGGGDFRLFPDWVARLGLASLKRRELRPFVFYLQPW